MGLIKVIIVITRIIYIEKVYVNFETAVFGAADMSNYTPDVN